MTINNYFLFISNIQKPLFFKNSPKISALKWLMYIENNFGQGWDQRNLKG